LVIAWDIAQYSLMLADLTREQKPMNNVKYQMENALLELT
jgi:hypothetical protein